MTEWRKIATKVTTVPTADPDDRSSQHNRMILPNPTPAAATDACTLYCQVKTWIASNTNRRQHTQTMVQQTAGPIHAFHQAGHTAGVADTPDMFVHASQCSRTKSNSQHHVEPKPHSAVWLAQSVPVWSHTTQLGAPAAHQLHSRLVCCYAGGQTQISQSCHALRV
jgi:hypothetical protein